MSSKSIIKKSAIWAFAAASVATLGLAACDDKTEKPTPTPPVDTVTYTVAFDANGGTAQTTLTYSSDEGALSLPTPEYYGHEFMGWYDNSALGGAAVDAAAYVPTRDVTLYAKWDPVTYIYFYYGEDGFEDKRLSYHVGDVVELDEAFTPEPLVISGVSCPFVGWTYEDNGAYVETVTVGSEHVILLAVYNKSGLPVKHHYTENSDGSVTATGNLAWEQYSAQTNIGVYSAEVAFSKGTSGGAGLAFRMQLSGNDYPYQDEGTTYLSAVLLPDSGRLQVASVTNGAFAHMAGSVVAFNAMPEAWQQKYNDATGDIKAVLTVVDRGDSFEIYIDGERAFTFTDSAKLAEYTGTGFGIRCSSTGSDFSRFEHRGAVTVSFDSLGGSACEAVQWLYGTIALPVPEKSGVVLEGWYYDSTLTKKVDPENFIAKGNVTLYAKYTDDYKTVKFETFGGSVIHDIYYTDGSLSLPTPTRDNSYFTGWYYDADCTELVDVDDFETDGDEITLYAGWRLPTANVADNGDGTYSLNGGTVYAVHGIADSLCGDYEIDIEFQKAANGQVGSVGIAFRVSGAEDNKTPASCMDVRFNFAGYVQYWSDPGKTYVGGVGLAQLPAAFKSRFDSAAVGDTLSVTLKLKLRLDSFEFYLDDELAYTSPLD